MRREIVGIDRCSTPGEIGRGGDEDERHRRADPDRYHIGLQALRVTDSAIEAVGDNIDEPVVDHQFDGDVGIGARKVSQPRKDGVDRRDPVRADPDPSCRSFAGIVEIGQRAGDRSDRRPQPRQQFLARGRRRQRPSRTVEQSNAQFRLERPHRVAERGGRQPQARRRPCETGGLDDRLEHRKTGPEIAIHS
jgi:hypothetical protein